MTQPPHYTHVPPPEPNPYYAQPVGMQQYQPPPKPKRNVGNYVFFALLALVVTAVLITEQDDESNSSAHNPDRPPVMDRLRDGGSFSGFSSDEREFISDFRNFASGRSSSLPDKDLVNSGHLTCEYLDATGGSDYDQVDAASIAMDAGMSMNDANALVATSVVNLCPEYR